MRALFLALPLGLAVCGNPQPFDPEIEVSLEEPFALRVAQSAEVATTGLRIRFDGVRDDSRCAVDVTCVWAGNARVQLTVDVDDEVEQLELNTTLDPQDVDVNGFSVALQRLQPENRSGVTIEPDDYVATLQVTRAP